MNEMLLLREQTKVIREIERYGKQYTVYREESDKDGEPTGETKEISIIRGLFHISKGYVTRETSDGTETHTKGQPQILCVWEEAKEIKNRDFVLINEQRYNITEKTNVQKYNVLCEINLEVVLNGNN